MPLTLGTMPTRRQARSTRISRPRTARRAANGLQVVSPGDLTLRTGDQVVLGVDFSVGSGGALAAEVDAGLKP